MLPQDEEFLKKLRATFHVEAEEHLQAMAADLLTLEKSPLSTEREMIVERIYREAHSLKGAARAVDLHGVESICQAMETIFSNLKHCLTQLTPEMLDVLHQGVDGIRALLDAPPAGGSPQARDSLLAQLARVGIFEHSALQEAPKAKYADEGKFLPPIAPTVADEHATQDTIRVAVAKLDAQMLRAEDLLPFKAVATDRAAGLRELASVFEQWQSKWAKVSMEMRELPSSESDISLTSPGKISKPLAEFLEWNADFQRSLEHRIRDWASRAQRDRHNIGKRLDELLEESKKLLMLPISTLGDIFPKIVRDLCRQQGKEADVVLEGGHIEMDKRILEEMKDVFIHVLRNCVDHGIESPVDRAHLGKRASATITIGVSQVSSSKVEILISDDGGGVDLDGIKEAAMRRGLVSMEQAQALNESQTLALAFHSDVTTSRLVTTISGRGLGMAIVRSKVEMLGGQATLESTRHVGTRLRILLPLTQATFRGVLIASASQVFVVPAANIDRLLRINLKDIQTVENCETISVDKQVLSLVSLADALELPRASTPANASLTVSVMVVQTAGERIAFVIDDVLHEEEVLVKPLRKPLVRVRNIAGAAILASGKPVLVLNINDLMQTAQGYRVPAIRTKPPVPVESTKRILVVEDSITSRTLLKGVLESAGYRVQVAVDGVDAYAQLRETSFDAVISDVEMPRLNGFDLTAKIRADKRLSELPVVLVTGLESRAHRERGIDVGASAYIVKSSFDQSNLVDVVRRLI